MTFFSPTEIIDAVLDKAQGNTKGRGKQGVTACFLKVPSGGSREGLFPPPPPPPSNLSHQYKARKPNFFSDSHIFIPPPLPPTMEYGFFTGPDNFSVRSVYLKGFNFCRFESYAIKF